MNHSFTDEQLLNLVNNTVTTKTTHELSEFTGGSIQITSTHNHQLAKYRVSLFFGYKNRNAIAETIDIKEEYVSIWQKALLMKVKSMQIMNNGMDISELNSLMNTPSKEVVSNKVVSNKVEVVSRSKGSKTVVRTSYDQPTKPFSFSLPKLMSFDQLSEEYKTNLKVYIDNHNEELTIKRLNANSPLSDEYTYKQMETDFLSSGKKQKDFRATFNKWKMYTYERESDRLARRKR